MQCMKLGLHHMKGGLKTGFSLYRDSLGKVRNQISNLKALKMYGFVIGRKIRKMLGISSWQKCGNYHTIH